MRPPQLLAKSRRKDSKGEADGPPFPIHRGSDDSRRVGAAIASWRLIFYKGAMKITWDMSLTLYSLSKGIPLLL